ncbi:hypothetical protein QUS22_03540 [Wolbachia pipientis]|nr:hypothetical protein [Wolbachia pipientis]MDM8335454.1 hypothetical protein [Wolbachia pipientis]
MVDDLDICSPKFIVDFLESIKYMLNIDVLVFIVSISRGKSNVHEAISTILGQNFDLRSFTSLSLHLLKQPVGRFTQKLFQDVKFPKKSKSLIIDSFLFYVKSLSLSLKTIEYCVKKIKLCFLNYTKAGLLALNLLVFLVVLRSINIDLYEKLGFSYQTALEKIEDEYKPIIFNHMNGQEKWEKLKIFFEATFREKGSESSKTVKQVRNILL